MDIKGMEKLDKVDPLKHEVGKVYYSKEAPDEFYIVVSNCDFTQDWYAMVDLNLGTVDTRLYESLSELDDENKDDVLLDCFIQII